MKPHYPMNTDEILALLEYGKIDSEVAKQMIEEVIEQRIQEKVSQ